MDSSDLEVTYTAGPPYRYEIREGGIVVKTSSESYGTTGDAMRAGIAEKQRIIRERE